MICQVIDFITLPGPSLRWREFRREDALRVSVTVALRVARGVFRGLSIYISGSQIFVRKWNQRLVT